MLNFAFLENYINNPVNMNNINCLLNRENINSYILLPVASESDENKKNKLTNLIKLIPHIIFYYYKYIKNRINDDMATFLTIVDNKVLIVHFLRFIENVLGDFITLLIGENMSYINVPNIIIAPLNTTNPDLYNMIYKINKIVYKSLEDLYEKLYNLFAFIHF
jgi:hypothetical protein